MNWRIDSVNIQNFKFFRARQSINVGGKNLLVYGENGSGKSSLYWALYTHFQANSKSREEACKYFMPDHPHNLRNKFAASDEDAYIEVVFKDEVGGTKGIPDSAKEYYPEGTEFHSFMRRTMMCSDFINYKFLSRLFDFRNSQENEVFSIFEKEFMDFIDFDSPVQSKLWDDVSTQNALSIWRSFTLLLDRIPKQKGDHSQFRQKTQEITEYNRLLDEFNKKFGEWLNELEQRVNQLLRKEFESEVELRIEYRKSVFNRKTSGRKFSAELESPKIVFKARMLSGGAPKGDFISHPSSFFNEAKLTCMALAVRLAILEKHPEALDCASVMFVDDLLVSLDMGVRKKVIPILLRYADKHQIVIFTHDRAFFHLVKHEIELKGKEDDWKELEIYGKRGKEPTPIIKENFTPLEKARLHLSRFELEAAANFARKECERLMCRLVPRHERVKYDENSGMMRNRTLGQLVDWFAAMSSDTGLTTACDLKKYRQLVLNPMSHYDIYKPLYVSELENIIDILDKLNGLSFKMLVKPIDIKAKDFMIEIANGEYTGYMKFRFKNPWYGWTDGVTMYFNNPEIEIVETDRLELKTSKKKNLIGLFSKLCNMLSLNREIAPQLFDLLKDQISD